jgi:hypothetical protein
VAVNLHAPWRKGAGDMLNISSVEYRHDFSIQVLRQMAWLRRELAKAEQKDLEIAELTSIRGAISKSLIELRALYKATGF